VLCLQKAVTYGMTNTMVITNRLLNYNVVDLLLYKYLEQRPLMEIKRNGTQTSTKGAAEYFTGSVRIDASFQGTEPARINGAIVTFEPGARNAWHTHPLGQTLIVTSGSGWVQSWGSPKIEIHAGDIISIACGEKHWHGATATSAMTHIAITESLNGKVVDWMEHVTDIEYKAES